VQAKCYLEVEGKFLPGIGFICAIINISNIDGGHIQPHFGFVNYTCRIKAIVLKAIVGEVVDAEIVKIDPDKVYFLYCGIIHGLVRFTVNFRICF